MSFALQLNIKSISCLFLCYHPTQNPHHLLILLFRTSYNFLVPCQISPLNWMLLLKHNFDYFCLKSRSPPFVIVHEAHKKSLRNDKSQFWMLRTLLTFIIIFHIYSLLLTLCKLPLLLTLLHTFHHVYISNSIPAIAWAYSCFHTWHLPSRSHKGYPRPQSHFFIPTLSKWFVFIILTPYSTFTFCLLGFALVCLSH